MTTTEEIENVAEKVKQGANIVEKIAKQVEKVAEIVEEGADKVVEKVHKFGLHLQEHNGSAFFSPTSCYFVHMHLQTCTCLWIYITYASCTIYQQINHLSIIYHFQ